MEPILGNWGEKRLLRRIRKYLGKSRQIVRVFSEDCAVIDPGGKDYELFSVDSLIEGIHFRSEYMPAFLTGRKAVKVNLSDISAMGGVPLYCLVSLGAPRNTPVRYVEDIYRGMESVFREAGIVLIGGNMAASPVFFLDLFLTGTVSKQQLLCRNGAREGDSIFVTGPLGASSEGLRLLREGFRLSKSGKTLIRPAGARDSRYVKEAIMAHFDPPSMNFLARKLAGSKMLSSMIDLSDGLTPDLEEICRESESGAVIDLARLPVSRVVSYWARKRKLDAMTLALCGGEDYHLLFTVSRKYRERFLRLLKKEKLQLFEIGMILNRREGIYSISESGKRKPLPPGYQHFL